MQLKKNLFSQMRSKQLNSDFYVLDVQLDMISYFVDVKVIGWGWYLDATENDDGRSRKWWAEVLEV